MSTLADADYVDMFTITTPAAREGTPEEWAACRESSRRPPWHVATPESSRTPWGCAWDRGTHPTTCRVGASWHVGTTGSELESASWYVSAEAVCLVGEGQVTISLALRYDRPLVAAPVWSMISGPHQRAVPVMLRQAVRLWKPLPTFVDDEGG